jgi:Domain of unknown function (DUF4136)
MLTRALPLAAAITLAGCAASIPPVQVTRFHLGGQIAPAPVAPVAINNSLERAAYDAAVARELARLGFAAGGTEARYTFSTEVTRDTRAAAPKRSPITIGVGGGTGGYGGGVGLGASFGLGGNKSSEIVVTRLSVQLKERGGKGGVIWEGRAETEAGSSAPAAQPGLAADKLATALFKDFPGESGRTITVP